MLDNKPVRTHTFESKPTGDCLVTLNALAKKETKCLWCSSKGSRIRAHFLGQLFPRTLIFSLRYYIKKLGKVDSNICPQEDPKLL